MGAEEEFWSLVADVPEAPPGALNVEVAVADTPYGDEKSGESWLLKVTFAGMGFRYGFLVHEPYCSSLEDWKSLAAGSSGMSFYMGNGDGSIEVDGPYMTFIGAPSGAGGDVTGKFRVRKEHVCPKLNAAIDEAVARGFRFYDPPSLHDRVRPPKPAPARADASEPVTCV